MRTAAVIVAVGSLTAAASANITLVSQERTLFAEAHVHEFFPVGPSDTMSQSDEAPDSGPWDRSLIAVADIETIVAQAGASQVSSFGSGGASGHGEISWSLSDVPTSMSAATTSSETFLRFVFNVGAPTEVAFTASVGNTQLAGVTLSGPSGVVSEAGFFFSPASASFSGVLQPGQYQILAQTELLVELGVGDTGRSGSIFWDFDLAVVPSPSSGAALMALGSVCAVRRRRRNMPKEIR